MNWRVCLLNGGMVWREFPIDAMSWREFHPPKSFQNENEDAIWREISKKKINMAWNVRRNARSLPTRHSRAKEVCRAGATTYMARREMSGCGRVCNETPSTSLQRELRAKIVFGGNMCGRLNIFEHLGKRRETGVTLLEDFHLL